MLTAQQLDAFGELVSIGAGHAATALSQLVDRKIIITVPKIEIIPSAAVPYALGGPETVVSATYVRVLGDTRGGLLFVMDQESGKALAGLLKGVPPLAELGPEDHEMLRNAGHVLLSACLNAISRMVNKTMVAASPAYAFDMVGAVLETVVSETEGTSDEAVLVDADFVEEEEGSVKGRLFYLPAPGSLESLMGTLGA
jgi:chemotaxis protein CheC